MSTPPFVRFYHGDWYTGVAGLKADERGVFISMCVYIWTTGRRVPLCDAEAARMMALQFNLYQRVRDKLLRLGKIEKHADGYTNKRAEHELGKASHARTDTRDAVRADAGSDATTGAPGRIESDAARGVEPGRAAAHSASGCSVDETAPADDPVLAASAGAHGGAWQGAHGGAYGGTPGGAWQGSGQKVQQNQTPSIELDSELDKEQEQTDVNETRGGAGSVQRMAHGVIVNCETVSHPSFTISIGAIELGIAGRLPRDEVKRHCVAHALQWAAEIEGGKSSSAVVPSKIANFLAATIMGDVNRGSVADIRKARFAPQAKKSLIERAAERRAQRQNEASNG